MVMNLLSKLVRVGNQLGKAIAMTINLFNPQKVIVLVILPPPWRKVVFPAIKRNVENPVVNDFP